VEPRGLFVPGFAVRGSLYRPGLPDDWLALDPPGLGLTKGRFAAHRDWLRHQLESRGRRVVLAGHSLGAALAICAGSERPDLVERLILFSPAGLPLSKPMVDSALLVVVQALRGLYPPREIAFAVAECIRHPLALHRLAREAHGLDLRGEFAAVASSAIPVTVVGSASDTLTTPAICTSIAGGLGGEYREVGGRGHMWMLTNWPAFESILLDRDVR
jgi:pimeloyl-ACP methyl ester carboxylesterase